MAEQDAAALAERARQSGLVTEDQLYECWDITGPRRTDPQALLQALVRKGYLTNWQGLKLLKGETDGYFMGGYRILYKIASGSFGRVFRADDPRTGEVFALKILRRRWSDNPHTIELFEREGKLGMALRHPNIVEIKAVSKDPVTGSYYIVMEFVEGGNLRDILTIRKKLAPVEALKITEDSAAALTYAFSRGMTHRDIKPTNILISTHGTSKLVDFGLAGIFSAAGIANDSQVDRTVDYAGLEKATDVKTGDERSDIYFLGCVLFEMLAGRAPLDNTRDRRARMLKRRFEEVRPLAQADVEGPASLFHLVHTMMALDPSQRYQTPSQLLEAVRTTRAEVEGRAPVADGQVDTPANSLQPRVFVVERNERSQDAIRDKLKELGYRVLLSIEAERAMERFRQQPYDGLVVDVASIDDEEEAGLAIDTFKRILNEAERKDRKCAGILVLAPEQSDLSRKAPHRPNVAVMVRPVTLKQLYTKLKELVPPPAKE